jgi:hypothetical protein
VRQLALRVQRVVPDDDRADPKRRIVGDDVLRAVRKDERDAVAASDPQTIEDAREPLDLGLECAV